MKRLILVAGVLALAACQSAAEQEAQRRAQWEQARAFAAAQDETTCKSYGLNPGTEAYANCRIQLDVQRRNAATQYDAMTRGVIMQRLLTR